MVWLTESEIEEEKVIPSKKKKKKSIALERKLAGETLDLFPSGVWPLWPLTLSAVKVLFPFT